VRAMKHINNKTITTDNCIQSIKCTANKRLKEHYKRFTLTNTAVTIYNYTDSLIIKHCSFFNQSQQNNFTYMHTLPFSRWSV